MKTTTLHWTRDQGWTPPMSGTIAPQLVLYFGATEALDGEAPAVIELAARFRHAVVCGCSTAGEIHGSRVLDGSIVAVLVEFGSTQVRAVAQTTTAGTDSREIGRGMARKLLAPDLRHVLVLSDGLSVNGSALIAGMREEVVAGVGITGGLAGDGARFQKTFVGLGTEVCRDHVVAVGFYGPGVVVGFGSRGGWEGFGPRRRITRAAGSALFELDGQPALALYRRYLGERAAGLPSTGLLFPIELTRDIAGTHGVVRTILAVNEAKQSLTFAGDMPEGWYARLMKASVDQLVEGAAGAGREAVAMYPNHGPALAIMVSCVGRRLVLGQRIDEELEAVVHALPAGSTAVGFYSYGEACPSARDDSCEFHNQTMTVTVIAERT